MPVKVLAVSKNYTVMQFLEGRLVKEIRIMDYCVLSAAFDMYNVLKPDVLLLEINWSKHVYTQNVYEVAAKLLSVKPAAQIVAITHFHNMGTQQAVQSAGIKGYVYLESPVMSSREVLVHLNETILAVGSGKAFFCERIPDN